MRAPVLRPLPVQKIRPQNTALLVIDMERDFVDENLVCCGVTTHVCVMNTVLTARNLDYRVLLTRDAVAAVSPDHQAAALLCMSDVFAYVTTSTEVRSLWDWT